MNIIIHCNSHCGTFRNVLAIIEAAGYQPTVIEYLKTGKTVPQLQRCSRPLASPHEPHFALPNHLLRNWAFSIRRSTILRSSPR